MKPTGQERFFAVFFGDFIMVLVRVLVTTILFPGFSFTQVLEQNYVKTNWKNISLEKAFSKIQEQTDFYFTYNFNAIDGISISNQNRKIKLADLLKYIAGKTNLYFAVEGEIIYVMPDQSSNLLELPNTNQKLHLDVPAIEAINLQELDNQKVIYRVSKGQEANERVLKGRVLDQASAPLPGASILIKETGLGSITNEKGLFTLGIPHGQSVNLIISYVGFQSKELRIGTMEEMVNIKMQPTITDLNQVVVIGYGTDTKKQFNGAVSKVDKQRLNAFSTATFDQALSGNVAGIQIFGNGKNPGDNSVIQIRGLTTLTAGTQPLIVVDGVPLTDGTSLGSINTQDIESVDILKDAASAAIYGSRASNGVILITTRKRLNQILRDTSKKGPRFTYDSYFGFQERIDHFELADAYATAQFDYDARNFGYISGGADRSITDNNTTRDANGGGKRSRIQPFLQEYLKGTPGLTNTDWAAAVFRPAPQQNHYLNITGNTNNHAYSVSFGYFDQNNIIINSDYKRYTSTVQFNSNISDGVRFGISTNFSFVDAHPTGEAGWSRYSLNNRDQADPAFSIILMYPYYPIYNTDGSLAISNQLDDNNQNWDGPISENTIAQVQLTEYSKRDFRVLGNTYAELKPFEGLKFKTLFGGDFNTGVEAFFAPSSIGNYRIPVEDNMAQAFKNNDSRENFIWENVMNYDRRIGQHAINALFGYSYQQEVRNRTRLTGIDFTDDNLRNIAGATNITATSKSSKWVLESFFGRVQYNFSNKYALSASLRRDGSSRFGANTQYGDFASFSAGWTLSNESFFPRNTAMSFAKLRFSWGQTGNNQIGDFASIALVNNDNYVMDNNLESGTYISTAPNIDLSWETNTALNFGIDLGFLENKLLLTAEYYTSLTTDLLLKVPVPQQSGFSTSLQNVGKLANKGFEFELKGNHFKLGKFGVAFNANLTTNENEVLALGLSQQRIIVNNGGVDFLTGVGGSVAQFYVYDIVGVYRSASDLENDPIAPLPGTEVGDYIVRDVNGDEKITPDDRTLKGDYNPDFTYGLGFNLVYDHFDLGVTFNGIEGRKAADRMVYYTESGEGFFVPSKYYVENYYSERNPKGFFRRPDFSSFSSAGRLTRASSLSVLDADYFRLRSLQLGYTFPRQLTNRLGVESLRLYITANNLLNISNFRGYNPDGIDIRSNERQTLSRGWIQSASPLTRFIAIGAHIKF